MPLHRPSVAFDHLVNEVENDRLEGHDLAIAVVTIENQKFVRRLEGVQKRSVIENRVLYAITLIALVLCVYNIGKVNDVADKNTKILKDSAQASLARCAATSAVIEQGRATIVSGVAKKPPPKIEASYRAFGLPPYEVRKALAMKQADAYANGIASRVEAITGKALLVDKKTGALNCQRLAPGSKARPSADGPGR